eukprot:CAMPEP_0182864164 /NCGR_PEP_ID=MMETSP0034_2-20130328/7028_1 /TAXON_ID=156128 /ORGANISM="Nephroselmis pyriformis, Strain CCMP717" /LENGTH=45 /DNA_ID= /DNA_START= /DNA_END= /DNA_ORIENTATION=
MIYDINSAIFRSFLVSGKNNKDAQGSKSRKEPGMKASDNKHVMVE